MKLKGEITICRSTGGLKGTRISIQLTDTLSHCRCITIEMTAEAFGEAVTGLGCQSCEFDFRPQNVGKEAQHKTVKVPFKKSYAQDEQRRREAEDALKPYEVDGWRGDVTDMLNHHRSNPDGTQTVVFRRHVDAT